MIKLMNLELNNFLSHVKTTVPLNEYKGLVLIEGITSDGHYSSNGAGKSTLLEGMIYALTGSTLRGVGVNEVINRNHKKNTKVSLEFMKEGVPYTVSRYRKDDTFGDSLILKKGQEDISKRVNKETQKLLEDIINISYNIVVSTMLLGEGLSSRFTQLSDPEKKSLIESTLNMQYVFPSLRAKANDNLSTLRLKKSNLEGKKSTFESVAEIDIETVKEQILRLEEDIKISEEEKSKYEFDKNKIDSDIKDLEKKINLLSTSILQYENQNRQILSQENQLNKLKLELNHILGEETPVCTLCKQKLSNKESLEEVLTSYHENIKQCELMLSSMKEELLKFPDIQIMKQKIDTLKILVDTKVKESNTLSDAIKEFYQKIPQSCAMIERNNQIISDHEKYEKSVVQIEEELKQTDKDIEKYDYFYKLFSPTGIIVDILAESVEYINTRIATYSDILLEKDYHIEFVKGKISLVDSKGSSYQSLSNGEKRRLDIAIQFSLHDYVMMYCGMKMDCCFIDEILDTLDDIGVENIFDVLRLKLEYCQLQSIYVITHNSALKDKFDKVITIKKDSIGDSYLV